MGEDRSGREQDLRVLIDCLVSASLAISLLQCFSVVPVAQCCPCGIVWVNVLKLYNGFAP